MMGKGLEDTGCAFARGAEGIKREGDEVLVQHGQRGIGLEAESIAHVTGVNAKLIGIGGFGLAGYASCSSRESAGVVR